MKALRWLHLSLGIAGFVAFLLTGQYMDRRLDHLVGMADAPRALYRSAHIYIFFTAMLHLGLGIYVERCHALVPRLLQFLASGLLLFALAAFLYGFIFETPYGHIDRPAIRLGIYGCLGGVALHGFGRLLDRS